MHVRPCCEALVHQHHRVVAQLEFASTNWKAVYHVLLTSSETRRLQHGFQQPVNTFQLSPPGAFNLGFTSLSTRDNLTAAYRRSVHGADAGFADNVCGFVRVHVLRGGGRPGSRVTENKHSTDI
jgi:hypothetical protein